jgi:hypothetical protein
LREKGVKMTLADVTHRIATDKNFAVQLRSEPRATLKATGLKLPEEALTALLKVLQRVADPTHISIESLLKPTSSWY